MFLGSQEKFAELGFGTCKCVTGQGSYGTVCRALDIENGFIFCIKKSVAALMQEFGDGMLQACLAC